MSFQQNVTTVRDNFNCNKFIIPLTTIGKYGLYICLGNRWSKYVKDGFLEDWRDWGKNNVVECKCLSVSTPNLAKQWALCLTFLLGKSRA